MPDIDNAAERVGRSRDHREPLEIIYGTDDFESAEWGYSSDIDALAAAYLAQQPSYAAQAAELAELKQRVEGLETMSPTERDLEFQVNENVRLSDELAELRAKATRLAEIERAAQADADDLEKMRDGTKLNRWGLVQIIAYQQQDVVELRAKLEAAEKEAALRSDMIDSDCMAAINTLRLNEGNSVTLICDNPDFGGPNNAIECSGDWTNWQTKRFTGDRLLTSLQSALKAYFAWHGEEWEPTKQLTALRTAAAPFEDSRVVDRDWLIANGFERADDTLPVFIRRINDVTVEAYCYKSKVSITVYDDYNAASRNYVKLLTNPTIGQLNHLLAALKPGGAK